MITPGQLKYIAPYTTHADIYAPLLSDSMNTYQINTPARMWAFLANLAEESQSFNVVKENLNYSAAALMATFKMHFTGIAEAQTYERNPLRIANRVYANRMGNGDEASGDGWRFIGRGLIMITGRDMYQACSKVLYGDDRLLTQPELLEQPKAAAASACWFWANVKGLNHTADLPESFINPTTRQTKFQVIVQAINGGQNGYQQRLEFYTRAKLCISAAV